MTTEDSTGSGDTIRHSFGLKKLPTKVMAAVLSADVIANAATESPGYLSLVVVMSAILVLLLQLFTE